jgi:hypothetical protein
MRKSSALVFLIGVVELSVIGFGQTATPVPAQTPARAPAVEPIQREVQLVALFDRNGDKRLDSAERENAREYLAAHPELRSPGRRGRMGPGTPGPAVSPAEARSFPPSVSLYDPAVLRTLFLAFDEPSWEKDLADFHQTDVDIPAAMSVDSRDYPGTGVHFRGHNSFLAVPEGRKRQLTLSPDFIDPDQRLLTYRGVHLLNAYQDPSFLRGVLFLHIARQYIPAPRANFVRVVINGESWGVYVNQQRFDTDFLRDHFGTTKGTRWRSLNNAPGGGLSYLGSGVAPYRDAYEIKSKDDPKAWSALMDLCRILNQTSPDRLVKALGPILDIDGALRLLALDNALMNGDGYWEDGSDYNLYLDPDGRFHLVPYDVNEAFRPYGSPRGSGPNRGVALEPFAMAEDRNKALLGKLLAPPELRARYLGYIRDIAETWLDWKKLEPVTRNFQALIAAEVARDSRKLYSTEEFTSSVFGDGEGATPPITTLKGFVDARRAFLLGHPDVRKAPRARR